MNMIVYRAWIDPVLDIGWLWLGLWDSFLHGEGSGVQGVG